LTEHYTLEQVRDLVKKKGLYTYINCVNEVMAATPITELHDLINLAINQRIGEPYSWAHPVNDSDVEDMRNGNCEKLFQSAGIPLYALKEIK
jgi:hypothetical protein